MFGWNKKKGFEPELSPDEIRYITDHFIHYISMFGLARLRKSPFITADHPLLQCGDLHQSTNFRTYWTLLCTKLEIDPQRVGLRVLDQGTHPVRGAWTLDSTADLVGVDKLRGAQASPVQYVEVARVLLDRPGLLTLYLTRNLLEAKAAIEKWKVDDDDQKNFLDYELMAIYLGFGIVEMNFGTETEDTQLLQHLNLLQSAVVYASALVCTLSGMPVSQFVPAVKPTLQNEFTACFEYISRHEPDGFSPNAIANSDLLYQLNKAVSDGFADRDYNKVLVAAQQKLTINPRDQYALNNKGYALL